MPKKGERLSSEERERRRLKKAHTTARNKEIRARMDELNKKWDEEVEEYKALYEELYDKKWPDQ